MKNVAKTIKVACAALALGVAAVGCSKNTGPAGSAAAGSMNAPAKKNIASIQFDNATFYKDGKFDVEKGKDAIIALMRYHGYPEYPGIREKIWVSDYGTGQFTKVGLAAVMWKNNVQDHYMLMDLFIMPNQMLPEHWHLDGEGNPAKREGWLVRYGQSHIVGEGEPNLKNVTVPAVHGKVSVEHEVVANPGDFVPLNREGAHHWQLAGPEGAIITEVANVHTDSAVRHEAKAINDNFLKGGK